MSAYTGLHCMMQVLASADLRISRHPVIVGGGSDRYLARGEAGTIEAIHVNPGGILVLKCTHGIVSMRLDPKAAAALTALQSLPVNMPDSERLEMDVTEFRDLDPDGRGSLANGGVKILGVGR